MNGFSFNGRMSRKFQNVVVQKRGRVTATPPIPLLKERTMTQSSTNCRYKCLMIEATPLDHKSNLKQKKNERAQKMRM